MASVYSVGQVNAYIKNMFNADFALNNIYIKGEISNCKYHTSGHIYFTLKDSTGVISAVMFAGNRKGLKFKLEEGQKVIALGSVSVYERDGKYQLYAKQIILEGTGLLYQRFEQLKTQLEEMGLFDKMYKKPIPKYATKVGICTASTGAAIQDIINISKRRNPFVQLYLYPCLVQGQGAAVDIVNAIRCLDSMDLDVIIVGRGETDFTIADFVADMRAPTPSAAAELAVFDYSEFMEKQLNYSRLLFSSIDNKLKIYRKSLKSYETSVNLFSPVNQLQSRRQYSDELMTKLSKELNDVLNDRKHKLQIYAERLNGMSPLNKISKGFAYVTDGNKKPLTSVSQVKADDEMSLIIKDGTIKAKVVEVFQESKE